MILWFWRKLFSAINSMPQFAERALILGDGPLVEPLLHEFESRPELGVRVVGHVLARRQWKSMTLRLQLERTCRMTALETVYEYLSRAVKL